MTKKDILLKISPPLDNILATQLLDEFEAQEDRYALRDWAPTMLDGGKFTEVVARIIFHQDSGQVNRTKSVDACLNFVEDRNRNGSLLQPPNVHQSGANLKSFKHIAKVLRATYKLRSDRGAIHIDPDYTANEMDARVIVECSRWVLAEILRISWSGPAPDLVAVIRSLMRFPVPVVGQFGDRVLVQRTDLTAEEEILVLLYNAGSLGLSRMELGEAAHVSAPQVTTAIQTLTGSKKREVIPRGDKRYQITDLGVRRVMRDLGSRLTLK